MKIRYLSISILLMVTAFFLIASPYVRVAFAPRVQQVGFILSVILVLSSAWVFHRLLIRIEEQKSTVADLKEALQVRDEFLSIASHELKTPLTVLTAQAQLMKKVFATGESTSKLSSAQISRLSDLTELQVKRLNRIVEDLLDLSRFRSGHFTLSLEEVELTSLINSVAEQLNVKSENPAADIRIHCSEVIQGKWDRGRLEQVLINLLSNAQKYGKGQPIDVHVHEETRSTRRVVLRIRDHGEGIAPEDHDRIFKRFERSNAHAKAQGLGLGLYIVRQILEAHGGEVKVESSVGNGSTFTVLLPLQARTRPETA